MKSTPLAILAVATLALAPSCTDEGGGYDDAGVVDPDDPDAATVDTDAPDTTITEAPATPSATAQASFSFTADEDDVTFRCRLDGGAFEACASPHVVEVSDGDHVFEVAATDAAGNEDATPASHAWTVDTVAPDTTITEAPPALDNSVAVSFEFIADEPAGFECRLDGGAFAACTTPHPLDGLADGEHTFEVRAVDLAGNLDASPAVHTWTIDSTTPDTVIDTGPTGTVASTTASFTFSSPDAGPGASYDCRLDGAAFAGCTSPASYTSLAQGAHTFEVRVRDAVGNLDPTPASRTWTVDTVAPDTTITGGPSGTVANNDPSFSFTSPEGGATFQCRLDGAAFAACTSPRAYTDVAEGGHTFAVRACDAVGNCDGSPASRTWTIDTVAPDTTIVSGPSGATSNNDPSFAFSSEAGAVFWCRLDTEAAFTTCTSPKSYTDAADGSRTFSVYACDAVGNCDASPATRTWTIDTVAPNTTIVSGPSGATNNNDPSFTFSSEAGATFQCRLDTEAGYSACTSPKSYTNAADGSRTFSVYACDAVGNCDASPATRTWTIDTVAPNTTLLSGPSGATNNNDPSFTFSSEAGAVFWCRLDTEAAFTTCTSPKSYTNAADGSRTFSVYACDAVGNCDASPATRTWTIDTVAPNTTIVSGPSGTTNNNDPSFTFSSEAGATFQCRLDTEAGYSACTSPKSYVDATDGSRTFSVYACDAVGNCDASPATRTWTIDTVAPNTTLSSQIAEPWPVSYGDFTIGQNGQPDFTGFQCSLDGGAWSACPAAYSATFGYGSFTLRARACDAAGNCDATPASFSWTADPGLVVYLPLDGDLANTTTLGPDHDAMAPEQYGPALYGLGVHAADGSGVFVPETPRPMSTSPDGGYTIAAWSYAGGVHRVLDFQGETGCYLQDAPADLFPGNSYVCCRGGDGVQRCTSALPVLPKQTWRHVALVSQPGTFTVTLFVNGQQWGTLANPTGAPFFDEKAAELKVGAGTATALDDVRLYNRALAWDEVCLLAGGNDGDGCYGVGPDLWLTMDNVFDDIGSWNVTATSDGGGYVAGVLSAAIRSVSPAFVVVRNLGGVGMYYQPDLLFSMWYRDTSGTGANAVLWDMRCDGAECNGTGGIRVAENGAGIQVCYAATPSGAGCVNVGATAGSWHHLAIRTGNNWTGNGYATRPLQIFMDGKLAAQLTPPANTNVFTNLPSFTAIGGYFENNATAATLDETRIYASFVPDDLICALSMGAWNGAVCN